MKSLSERIFGFFLALKAADHIVGAGKRIDFATAKQIVIDKLPPPIKVLVK